MDKNFTKNYFYHSLIILISIWVFFIFFLKDPESNDNKSATFPKLIEGKAKKPYVYRRLIPDLTKYMDMATPDVIADPLRKVLHKNLPNEFFGKSGRDWILAYLYANVLAYLSLIFSYFYVIKIKKEVGIKNIYLDIFYFLGIPPFLYFRYIYDFTTLFLFSASYYYCLKKRDFKYLIFFLLSSYNKETSLFLILFFLLTRELKEKEERTIFGLQVLIYGFIRSYTFLIYKGNKGLTLSPHFDLQFQNFFSPYTFSNLFVYILIIYLIFGKWKEKPLWLKKSLFIFPIYLILFFFFGIPQEYRIFLDIYPLLFISSILTINSFFKGN